MARSSCNSRSPCFVPQQHPFFTSHEAKDTDVASFVTVILED